MRSPAITAPTTVGADAYGNVANVTSLPDTGFFLVIPAAGLALGGLGTLALRRRRS